jgi:hypothetical protein
MGSSKAATPPQLFDVPPHEDTGRRGVSTDEVNAAVRRLVLQQVGPEWVSVRVIRKALKPWTSLTKVRVVLKQLVVEGVVITEDRKERDGEIPWYRMAP